MAEKRCTLYIGDGLYCTLELGHAGMHTHVSPAKQMIREKADDAPSVAALPQITFGPTYETRNKQYAMDAEMRAIYYSPESLNDLPNIFREGLAAGRIWEVGVAASSPVAPPTCEHGNPADQICQRCYAETMEEMGCGSMLNSAASPVAEENEK